MTGSSYSSPRQAYKTMRKQWPSVAAAFFPGNVKQHTLLQGVTETILSMVQKHSSLGPVLWRESCSLQCGHPTEVPTWVPTAPLAVQLSVNGLGKPAEDGSSDGAPAHRWESGMKLPLWSETRWWKIGFILCLSTHCKTHTHNTKQQPFNLESTQANNAVYLLKFLLNKTLTSLFAH